MLRLFIVQLPFSVCTVWFLLTLFKSRKSVSDRLIKWVMGLLAVAFYCGSAHLDPNPNYIKMAVCDLLMQFSTLAVFPIICLYIKSCYDDFQASWVPYLSTVPSLVFFAVSLVLTCMLGLDRSAFLLRNVYEGSISFIQLSPLDNAYYIFAYQVYFIVFIVSLSVALIYVFVKLFSGKFKFNHISAFLRGQKSSFVANMVCLFFAIHFIFWGIGLIFNSVFLDSLNIWSTFWSLITAILMFLVGYVTAVPPLPGGYLNMERLRHPFSAMNQSRQEFLQGIDSGPMAGAATSGYDKIMESFKQHMEKEQGFLNPMLTIEEISRTLNTNRTYVSKLVNLYYGMPFRDYLNKLRMDYAKQLMTDEPDASLDYIAAKSGFQSSTQFIRKFRETEGVTPTVWKTLQRQKK